MDDGFVWFEGSVCYTYARLKPFVVYWGTGLEELFFAMMHRKLQSQPQGCEIGHGVWDFGNAFAAHWGWSCETR